MKSTQRRILLCTGLLAVAFGQHAWAADSPTGLPESYIALLRSNIQPGKTDILARRLSLSDDEAKRFWPLQRSYEADLAKLGDSNLDTMRTYARNWDNLSEQTARDLGRRLFEYQKKRAELRAKYFDRISNKLSPTIAAKYFQLEVQIENLLDIGAGALVPLVK